MTLSTGEATVTVSSNGTILFDSSAIAAFDFHDVESVALVYSVAAQRLVIRSVGSNEAGVAVEHRTDGIHLLDCGGFLRDLGLLSKRKRRCSARWDSRAELIVVRISQVGPIRF